MGCMLDIKVDWGGGWKAVGGGSHRPAAARKASEKFDTDESDVADILDDSDDAKKKKKEPAAKAAAPRQGDASGRVGCVARMASRVGPQGCDRWGRVA